MRILMLGDVVGKAGRLAVSRHLPKLVGEHRPDLVIANGENIAGGLGITEDTALPLFTAGVDVITLGNHVWAQKGTDELLRSDPRIIRPFNIPPGLAGGGAGVFDVQNGGRVGVISLLGRTFMAPMDDPFRAVDAAIEELRRETPVIIIDIHAEATSEKGAIGWHVDGRASAVLGTHTHVPTCDEKILPGGTAFISDVGMVGPRFSILGMKIDAVLQGFRYQRKTGFQVADGPAVVNSVFVDIDDATGRATAIFRCRIVED